MAVSTHPANKRFNHEPIHSPAIGFDGNAIVAVSLILFLGFILIADRLQPNTAGPLQMGLENSENLAAPIPNPVNEDDLFQAPYEHYTITQGPHGEWYGHLAIDIAAGKDTPIASPINVSALYIDQWGNPTLVIENNHYQVTLLHGNYIVSVGDRIQVGQTVGTEGNNGYTTDMQGVPCAGRDCGYHTHLNVFDKLLGQNVNPLTLLDPGGP